VRPLARGGAFIAGADDLGSIAYNPAGFFDSGAQVLVDASWLHFTSDYTRRSLVRQVDPNTGEPTGTEFLQTYPEVHGTSPILPIPTLAGSFRLPRYGTGARKGLSVSVSRRSSGTRRTV